MITILTEEEREVQTDEKIVETKELIDCGAERNFLDKDFMLANQIPTFSLKKSIKAKNINKSINRKGEIMHAIWLSITVVEITK